MKKILFLLLFSFLFSKELSKTFVISDYDMTNQNYSFKKVWKFVKSYKNTALTYEDVEYVVRFCYMFKLNPVFILARMQMESDLVVRSVPDVDVKWLKSRAMGYGLAKKIKEDVDYGVKDGVWMYKYGGYEIQVYFACRSLRDHFDIWKPTAKKEVLDLKEWVTPDNAATYANYVYTPFYGKHNFHGWKNDAIGISAIYSIMERFKKRWVEINGL